MGRLLQVNHAAAAREARPAGTHTAAAHEVRPAAKRGSGSIVIP
jgi:hypothetical protein